MLTLLALAAVLAGHHNEPAGARVAPPVYATHNYALTFRVPPGATYCPLPANWVGSDHGTVVFLRPPRHCDGSGFPSSSRGFEPADTPRIEVYYGYSIEDEPSVPPCDVAGRIRLIGSVRPMCRKRDGDLMVLQVDATYQADAPAEVSIRLVTTPARLERDTVVLRRLARSLSPCRVSDATPPLGSGADCPEAGWF